MKPSKPLAQILTRRGIVDLPDVIGGGQTVNLQQIQKAFWESEDAYRTAMNLITQLWAEHTAILDAIRQLSVEEN